MMAAPLTENEFSKHVNTKFRVTIDANNPIDLDLVEVKSYSDKDKPREQGGMERFSLFFKGPLDPLLPQATYSLSHEAMGSLDIFIVPIGRDEQRLSYEAVFNYFKETST